MAVVAHLNIDLETFSSVDIKKSGLYKYVQSPDFQILLFAYSLDGGQVSVVDFTKNEQLPPEIQGLLFDPSCIKHAYNAAFEWYCLGKYLDEESRNRWLSQWRCTMLHGLYCGYPAGLSALGKALGLPEERQKYAVGFQLIKYFCTPCKPTKTGGGRSRNLPQHDPEKWALFCDYNRQDVVAEEEILKRLSAFPVPDFVQKQWENDMVMNARGVAVDLDLVGGALEIGEATRRLLMEEAGALSGLQNPNSRAQLQKWLEEELDEGEMVEDLKKDTVEKLLKSGISSDKAARMLEIRLELSKTSTKKYNAMAATVCEDGRIRGLLQFYGANRTGRWAGRLVQVQNLPRSYLEPLDLARELVKKRKIRHLELIFGSLPDTLSQLIRTAFVAKPGFRFVDADFSAIEARVIAWLAREEWVLEVFRTHGKIYEACAAQMFGVPMETIQKGRENYGLRQKGKVATLALGYQGGVGALKQMKALEMGIPEEELPEIVSRWRQSNKRIRDFWYAVEHAAIEAVKTGYAQTVGALLFARELDLSSGQDFLTLLLPSGRKLYYAHPYLEPNQWGKDALRFWGMDQTSKKWKQIETYGGKLAENIVQAVARDCLADALLRLHEAGFPVVFHVHDEVVVELPETEAKLDAVSAVMGQVPSWAEGLPLGADGWVDVFYKKD